MKSYVEKLKESNKKRLINHGVRLENELREKRLNYNDFPKEQTRKCIERLEREIQEITEFLHTIFIENEVAVYKGKLECRSKKSIIEKIEEGELENDKC